MADVLAFLLLAAALSNLGLGWFVWRREPDNPVNRLFSLMVFFVALWVLATFGERLTLHHFFSRSAYAMAALVSPAFYVFSLAFTRPAEVNKTVLARTALLGLVGAGLCYSPLIITSFSAATNLGVIAKIGPLFLLYVAYILIYLGGAFYHLFVSYRRAPAARRFQIQYMIIGATVFAVLAVVLNLLLPLLGNFRFSQVGPAASLFFVSFTTYAIIAHQLLNIDLILSRSTLYLSWGGMIIFLNFLFLYFFQAITGVRLAAGLFTAYSLFVVGLIFLFTSFRQAFGDMVNRVVYHDYYDYAALVREVADRLVTKLDLPQLVEYLTGAINRSMGMANSRVFLIDEARQDYVCLNQTDPGTIKPVLTDSPLGRSLAGVRRVWFWRGGFDFITDWLTDVRLKRFFTQQAAEVFLPLVFREEFIGFLLLGAKSAGDYSGRDRGLLTTLARQASVAIGNARLVEEQRRNVEAISRMDAQAKLTAELEDKNLKLQTAYEKLTAAQAELIKTEKLAVISDITLTLQDEVNNPLTVILLENWTGLARLQREGDLPAEEFAKTLNSIRDSAARIKSVMTKLRQVEAPGSERGRDPAGTAPAG